MSERTEEAISELRDLANEIRSMATDVSYGHFRGGDPRNFSPDPECSTKLERQAHQKACAEFESGKGKSLPGPHAPLPGGCGYITLSGFGLGTNYLEDPQLVEWADILYRCVERLEEAKRKKK